jgi:hypothetical protein
MQNLPFTGFDLASAYMNDEGKDLTKLLAYFQAHSLRETDWLELKAAVYPLEEDIVNVINNNNLSREEAIKLESKGCYWAVAKAAISLINTVGGMIVIGINESDFQHPVPLIDGEVGSHQEFLENVLYPQVVQTKTWEILKPNKGKQFVDRMTADSRLELKDYISLEQGRASGKPVWVMLVRPLKEDLIYTIKKTSYDKSNNNNNKESNKHNNTSSEMILVRQWGDIGRTDDLKHDGNNSSLLKFVSQRKDISASGKYKSTLNEIKKFIFPGLIDSKSQDIAGRLRDAIKSFERIEIDISSNPGEVISAVRQEILSIIRFQTTNIDRNTSKPSSDELELFWQINKSIFSSRHLIDSLNLLLYKLFDCPINLTSMNAKNIFHTARIFIEELLENSPSILNRNDDKLIPHHNLPRRGIFFSSRDEQVEQIQNFLRRSNRNHYLTITGVGGIGKTSLALEAAYKGLDISTENKKDSIEYYFENIIWLSAQNKEWKNGRQRLIPQPFSTLDDFLREILLFINPNEGLGNLTKPEREACATGIFRKQRTLVILDNLETIFDQSVKDFFNEIPDPSKVIVTDRGFADSGVTISLSKLSLDQSTEMLSKYIRNHDEKINLNNQELERLANLAGGIPRIIQAISNIIAIKKYSVESCEKILKSENGNLLYESLFDWSFKQINEQSKHLIWLVSILGRPVSEKMLAELTGLSYEDVHDAIQDPIRLTLLNATCIDRSIFHDKPEKILSIDAVTRRYISIETLGATAASTTELDLALRLMSYLVRNCGIEGWISNSDIQIVSENKDHEIWVWSVLSNHGHIQEMLNFVYAVCPSLGHLGFNDLRLQWSREIYDLIEDDHTRIEDKARLLISNLGWVNFIQHRHNEALAQFELGLSYARKISNIRLESMAIKSIGQILKEKGDLEGARTKLYLAVQILVELGDTHEMAVCMGTLSSLERECGDIDAALKYLHDAIFMARNLRSANELEVVFQQKLARLYLVANRLDDAERENRNAERLNLLMKREAGIAHARQLDALILEAKGLYVEAYQKCREAFKLFKSIGMMREIINDYNRMRNRISDLHPIF